MNFFAIKTFFTFSIFFLGISFSGCKSTPIPTGDRIVSISWVNPTPESIAYIESAVCENEKPFSMKNLPGYSEKAVTIDQLLYKNCSVHTKILDGSTLVSLGTSWLEPPLRKSLVAEYNLRIHLSSGFEPKVTLEPIRLKRARLGK
jgi:hypothetical protein